MVEIEDVDYPPIRAIDAADNDEQNVVSTGETSITGEADDCDDMFSATDEDFEEIEKNRSHYWDSSAPNSNHEIHGKGTVNNNMNKKDTDLLYDENLDEEDEAYVYKHMRGGMKEVNIKANKDHNSSAISGKAHRKQIAKPRHSDAVLSCPCCFNIVSMDCQKHKRYANQYRAMFVMGVVVDWTHILVYDEIHRALVSKMEQKAIGEGESDDWYQGSNNGEPPSQGNKKMLRAKLGEFYAVECVTCRTQVAALDMTDEVYYFHGCLESSSVF